MPEKYIRRNGLPLLLRHTGTTTLPQDPPTRGKGAAIVCLHDAGLQSSVFGDLLSELDATLAGEGCALAFDQPGHGRSGSLDALPSIEAMAEMASWVTKWCRIDRAVLVGHGMGALVALEWARTRPESVAGLVLCGVGLTLGIEAEAIETMRLVSHGKAPRPFDPSRVARASGPDLMRRAYMEGIGTDPRATLVDLEASRAWRDSFETASAGGRDDRIGCPVRIGVGDAEPAECRSRAEALAGSLARAEAFEVADAAHFLPLEQPSALAREIQRLREAA